MKRILVAWLALALALWIPSANAEQTQGAVVGQVTNGTPGGGSVADLEVTLRILTNQGAAETLSARTDAEGRFRFEGVPKGPETRYMAQVSYQDVIYSSSLPAFEPEQNEITTTVTVYETTTDKEHIRTARAHLLLNAHEGSLVVTEMHVLDNAGDRTYIGTEELEGRRWVSRFWLPQGIRALTFEDGTLGGRFLAIAGGFVDAEPLWPGRTSVVFSYILDCGGQGCDLGRDLTWPIENLNVLLPARGMQILSDQVRYESTLEAQGREFANYVGRNLATGTRLALRVRLGDDGSTPLTGAQTRAPSVLWLGLLGLVALVALGYPFWKRRLSGEGADKARDRGKPLKRA
ncbi:MAG: carboxypeptidase regulatory-like domain-containing protein [Chloroflexi bacterium]|nr:carboxypeptidase regulatory-like domain-containing protein [Chloroflexota bacterium]